jgi:hypothetical protein
MRAFTLAAAAALPLLLGACWETEGPAERAGRQLDNAAQELRDRVDPPSGPAERAGRALDRATN